MNDLSTLPLDVQHAVIKDLADKALQKWGLVNSDLELIKYRENAVFKVVASSGEQFALRLHRPGYHSDVELRSELEWIQALKASDFDVPNVIPSIDNKLLEVVEINDVHQAYQVDLFAWVDGEQLGSLENGLGDDKDKIIANFLKIGELAAELHNQSTQWKPETDFHRHAWDLEGLIGEEPFWGRFWELESLSNEQVALLQEVRKRARAELEEFGIHGGNYSLIHADFVPENLLVDGDTVRLIDFDDAGFGWHLFELATALYFVQDDSNYEVAKQSLIEGYRTKRPLPDRDLDLLDLFLTMRGVTYLGWVQSRQETETAQEMTPFLVDLACRTAERYLKH